MYVHTWQSFVSADYKAHVRDISWHLLENNPMNNYNAEREKNSCSQVNRDVILIFEIIDF